MTAEEIIESIWIYLDMLADECNMASSIEHKDTMAAFETEAREVNRKGLLKE